MGLDMYLEGHRYVGGQHEFNEAKGEISFRDGESRAVYPANEISEIIISLAYWCKANAIHKWFVDNVQGGVDECQKARVSKEQLMELLETAKKVRASIKQEKGQIANGYRYVDGKPVPNMEEEPVTVDASVAEALLPTQSGFFFGATEYDQWYVQDLDNTIEQLEEVLARPDIDRLDIYYQASW